MEASGVRALELPGLFVSLAACLGSVITTLLPHWLSLSTQLLPTESFRLGLWETCVLQELGVTECRPYLSLLGLPSDIRLARVMMCASLAAGLAALLFSVPGVRLVGCGRAELKRTLRLLGGLCGLLAGVLGLVPVSYVAHLTVLRFFDESVPGVVPRWEFGDALFLGWSAGGLHLVAGALMLASCLETRSGGRAREV